MLTVSGKCMCEVCEKRTTNQYRMVGYCTNCKADNILMLFRAGDKARPLDCPVCQVYRAVMALRPATYDEFPEAESPASAVIQPKDGGSDA